MSEKQDGVFISHIVQEKPVALRLQEYIRKAFGPEFPVFVSTDQTSIGGGRPWFEHIIASLRKARVILVLVSQESHNRPWINFEGGFGAGAGACVIPVGLSSFPFSKLLFPLAGYNGRNIDDIEGILSDISRETGLVGRRVDGIQYREDMKTVEDSLIYKSFIVKPLIDHSQRPNSLLGFSIENNGNTDLELLMVEAWVPIEMTPGTWHRPHVPGLLQYISEKFEGREYWHCTYTSSWYPNNASIDPLRMVLTRSMGTVRLMHPRFALEEKLAFKQLPIFFQVHARNYDTVRDQFTLEYATVVSQ